MNLRAYLSLCGIVSVLFLREVLSTVDLDVLSWRNLLPKQNVTVIFVAYIVFLAVLGEVLPGKLYPGVALADGSQMYYKCNGLTVLIFTVALYGCLHWLGVWDGSWIAVHYLDLLITANWIAFALATYLFLSFKLFGRKNWFQQRGFLTDFILGCELNPNIWKIDVKFFWLRPSMIGWLLINMSHLLYEFNQYQKISGRMLCYQLLTSCYIFDYFYNEVKMTSTWDIIAEHFGLMLAWGDIVFIPFAFSIQCRYLVDNFAPLKVWEQILIGFCALIGSFLFRSANSQKHQFKHNPKAKIWGKEPATIGGKLLVSGFWGIARHINYTGDLLLALAFCLPCGYASIIPYFYFFYLFLLLIHRNMRDEKRCANRYGALWEEYCRRVPHRLIPFVY